VKIIRLLAVLVLVTSATTTGIATTNEAPLPDAGLDQTVTRDATVHLDAGGSRDPDGRITDYDWRIDTPSGSTTEPNCADCERTQFQTTRVGEYTVTLTVTDDDGATATDTLYVQVEPGAPPSVSLAGPTQLSTGERNTYTATVDAGAAPLDRLVWYTDGERHATLDIDGNAASIDRPLQFPDAGTHDITVAAVDDDEQRGDATHAVDVTTPRRIAPTTPAGPTDSADDTTATPPPDIQGPRTVTGDAPLDATYSLTNGTVTADWFLDDHHVDVGTAATLTLSPGRHDLYAAPDRAGVSTFPDGTRSIVADPAPNAHLERVTDASIVTVDAYATDDLENLQSLEVLVDGDVRRTTTLGGIRRRSTDGNRLTAVERLTDVTPGTHNITVRATDSRGQTDSESRTITVPGPPEVMNARFVNDEPLTSKHPKLDPEDYTGEFEVDVKLNGVDPKYVEASFAAREPNTSVERKVRTAGSSYGLSVRQNFSTSYRGALRPITTVIWERGTTREVVGVGSDRAVAELAEPVIRLDLINAQNSLGRRGATFDASESFDPDGTEVTFEWNDLNSSDDWDGPVKRLNPRKFIYLNVTDEQGQYNRSFDILDWFTPGLQTPKVQNTEPVFPQESVTYRVRTNHYELSKSVYEEKEYGKLIDFELVSEAGTVSDHKRFAKDKNSGEFDQNLPEGFNEAYLFHQWNVTVPASEFLDGDPPTVRIQSTDQKEAFREIELPNPGLYEQVDASSELTELDVDYVEKRPGYEVQRTTSSERKNALQRMGFELYAARQTGREYHLENRVKTDSAEWETVTRDFSSKFRRKLFVDGSSEWRAAGSSEQRRERTVVERVWRNSKDGGGEFTGDTRQIQVEPADVETLREYEYERTYHVEVTKEEERRECMRGLGCWKYTVETTETETRTTEYDYWSSIPRNPSHHWTGATRVRTVDRAEYERQYEFRVENTETYWDQVYHASTREKFQPAQYEWQQFETVASKRGAAIMTTVRDVRLASTEPTLEWTLRRQDGTVKQITDSPEDRSRVVETEVSASADIEAEFLPPNSRTQPVLVTKERSVDVAHTIDGFVPIEEAKNTIRNKVNKTHADDY